MNEINYNIDLCGSGGYAFVNPRPSMNFLINYYSSLEGKINDRDEYYISPPEHLSFFSPYSLSKLLEKNNFKIESVQYVSRIPLGALEKRFPKLFVPFIRPIIKLSFKVLDIFHLGLFIHIYARKIK